MHMGEIKKRNVDYQAFLMEDKMDDIEDDAIARAFMYDTDEEAEEAAVARARKRRGL